MIHNRTVKEVRRYDIFKLVVLLVLLLLLIFLVWRDEEELSRIATGEATPASSEVGTAYPAGESDADTAPEAGEPYPAEDAGEAYPADEASGAYPADEAGEPLPEDEAGEAYPANETGESQPADEAGEAYPAGGEDGTEENAEADQAAPAETPAYPGPNEGQTPSAEGEGTADSAADQTTDEGTQPAGSESVEVEPPQETTIDEDALFAGESEIGGNGIPGTTVVVLANDQEIASAEVANNGSWSAAAALEAGPQSVVLRTVSADGDILSESEPIEVTVQEPILPTVDLPPARVYAFGLVLNGTGQPRTDIQVIADDIPLTTTSVNKDGQWTADVNLSEGTYNIDVATVDGEGNIVEQVPGLTLPVLPLTGPRLRTSPEKPEFDPITGLFLWRGAAVPGTQVAVIANGNTLGTAVADDEGQWEVAESMESGVYDIAVAEVDEGGNTSAASETQTFDLDLLPPELQFAGGTLTTDESDEPVVDLVAGNVTWNGQAEPNSQIAIVIDKEISVTTTANEAGEWSVEDKIVKGDHQLQLGTLDAGSVLATLSKSITVHAMPSPAPVIDKMTLDAANGNVDIIGTTTPDTTVNLLINGGVLATGVSDADGNFIFEIRLSPGTYEIQIESLDADGNVAYKSAPQTLQVTVSKPPESTDTGADAVAGQESSNTVDAASAQGSFSTLLAGLEAVGLTGTLAEVEQPHTLFAPTDDAFAQLPTEIIEAWNQNPLSYGEMLYYLVLDGRYTQEELLETQVLPTITGMNIGVTTDGQNVLVNGVPILQTIPAGSSIVHAITEVILPPLELDVQPPIINESAVPVADGELLTVTGTAETGKQILLQVSGENFGEIVTTDENGLWEVTDTISAGVHDIVAYMLDDDGTLMAVSQTVSLPVR